MNDFYSPSRVAHERGKEVRKPWVALLRFLMMVQHSCSSTGRELQREPSRAPPALCWSQESIRKEKEHLMLSWSLLTGTVAVIQWPELLDQCGNLGYLTSYIQLRWLFFFLVPSDGDSAIHCGYKYERPQETLQENQEPYTWKGTVLTVLSNHLKIQLGQERHSVGAVSHEWLYLMRGKNWK